jgi:predicted  nucleic acid-binding Zn-ribbon protein
MGKQSNKDNMNSKRDNKKIKELEKEIKILENTLKDKHPNNLSNLLRAVKPSFEDQEETRILKKTIDDLQNEIDKREKEYDNKIRSLRQEYERFKIKKSPSKENLKNEQIKEYEKQIEQLKS